ncbi:MAG: glycoside hydrolase family 19 protein, partial [Acidobacteriota bacterium]
VNGLDDRMMLLDQAKTALGLTQPAAILEDATHRVSVAELNLRNQPRVSSSTRIGSLHEGAEVVRLGDASVPDWWQIRTLLSERLVEGFVAFRFLEALPQQAVSLESGSLESASLEGASLERVARTFVPLPLDLPETHLRESRREVTRQEDGYRAFPLGEKGKPRRSGTLAETKARQLGEIVDYLDSESAEHRRYWPKRGTTFCNIYAYDYCYLAGVFLPRVWWTERAQLRIQNGEEVPVVYNQTVRELNANRLYDWLPDFGGDFGWHRVFDLDELQAAANIGEVCLIVAQQRDLNRRGHISAVVPEQDDVTAARDAEGHVRRPLESQAGRKNHRRIAKSSAWWARNNYRFSFWRHD